MYNTANDKERKDCTSTGAMSSASTISTKLSVVLPNVSFTSLVRAKLQIRTTSRGPLRSDDTSRPDRRAKFCKQALLVFGGILSHIFHFNITICLRYVVQCDRGLDPEEFWQHGIDRKSYRHLVMHISPRVEEGLQCWSDGRCAPV
ncbi:hypothetical protein M406DRAFT_326570 [Cryphonectria parasitica EP155]|uniref:Uncharacterized protein n=1 Tax=Cryphonectria parasitica (strain ATCC 38755 / EP155) TaxID=660469 RepID=A0A9P4YDT2_CRYP1|nr:uncharacterized protein M406DRAFT_326570 [Cryphonectria parasitica EP155]KAF3771173.1 hypothetical protein M406DRAFT_326570 [Cryphonectria parasitica EP155]